GEGRAGGAAAGGVQALARTAPRSGEGGRAALAPRSAGTACRDRLAILLSKSRPPPRNVRASALAYTNHHWFSSARTGGNMSAAVLRVNHAKSRQCLSSYLPC